MNLLLVLLLSAGGVIGSIMILKSQFRKLRMSMSNMLVGGLPLIGGKEEGKSKVKPSLAGPISNPDIAKVDPNQVEKPKLNMPWNAGKNIPMAGAGSGGFGAVVGVVNAIGVMPQTGNIRNMGVRTITGVMPQSGMIYNRARKFGNLEQNAGQIVNQMSGGRLTLNQNGNAQSEFTTKSIHANNVRTMNPSGLDTFNAKRIRTISAVNGQSIYHLGKGIGTIKGVQGEKSEYHLGKGIRTIRGVQGGTSKYNLGKGIGSIKDVQGGISEYHLGKGIRKISGVRGTSKYHFSEGIRKIKGVQGTSTYNGKGQIEKIKNVEGISTFNTRNGISAIKRVRGTTSFSINGKVEKLKLRAPSSNNVIYSTKLPRRYTRKLSKKTVATPIPTMIPSQVFVAPKGTLKKSSGKLPKNGSIQPSVVPVIGVIPHEVLTAPKGTLASKTNVGLAVNDIFSPKVYNLQSAHYSINTTQLSTIMDLYNDPKNSDLTNKEKNRLYVLKRISENDEMFGIGTDMLDRQRENLDDWFRTAIKAVPELSAREQLDVVKKARDLNSARTRRDRSIAAQKANSMVNVEKEDEKSLDNLLKATSLSKTGVPVNGNPIRDNLDSFIDSNYDLLSEQEVKDIEIKAKENIQKRNDLTPKERERQYKIETGKMEKETKEKNKKDIEEMLKADIVEDSEKGKMILGEDGYEIVQKEFKKNRKKRDDMYARIVSRQEMSKINGYRKQNPNISAYEAKRQMQEQQRQDDIFNVVNQLYPEYSNQGNENNFNIRPNIHEVRTF